MKSEIKLKMLEICNYGGTCDLSELKKYLISMSDVFRNLFEAKKEIVVEKTENSRKLLDILISKNIISNYKKVRGKEEFSVKAI